MTVVAPDVCEAMRLPATKATAQATDGRSLDVQLRRYERGEVAGYQLVVAATRDPDVNAAVCEDASEAGVWVNVADDPAHCSMVLPAIWRCGPVTISVSTDGISPALASWLRTRLAESAGDHVGQLATLLGEARHRLQEEGRPTESVDWRAILEGPITGLVAAGRLTEAAAAIGDAVNSPGKLAGHIC